MPGKVLEKEENENAKEKCWKFFKNIYEIMIEYFS